MGEPSIWMTLWPGIGWVVWIAGAALLALGLAGRRPKSAQCRRCQYPLGDDAASRLPVTCPECGRVTRTRRRLFKRRRSLGTLATALGIMFLGRSVWAVPQVQSVGWVRLVPSSVITLLSPVLGPMYLKPTPSKPGERLLNRVVEDYQARSFDGVHGPWQDWVFIHGAATGASIFGIPATVSGGVTDWSLISAGDIVDSFPTLEAELTRVRLLDACRSVNPDGWTDNGGAEAAIPIISKRYLLVGAPPETILRVRRLINDVRAAARRGAGRHPVLDETPAPTGGDDDVLQLCYGVLDLFDGRFADKPAPGQWLLDTLAQRVSPDEWDVRGGDRVRGIDVGGVLVIQAPRSIQVGIDAALADLRRR